ncbi:sugar kinase [Halalkalibacter okhensis]|uniref:2-dehydro-3-deoxygluconokinase n=1 Tax=Halalkalibacter okhensis TaxID=333138 RepID=A0A0B0IDL2_9BACI|nr:sugar kinase [Halalkalibacter okhensis]KHF38947.1 2-dehydro-3-deoxygluconokinase [Halalkalibacter okhensis]
MDIVTIGETMVLLTPENGLMKYATTYNRKYGGAESNFAIGISRLGHQAAWISQVGNDELGKGMISFIRGEGVHVDKVKLIDSASTGLYFKEVRNESDVRVQYYRKGSAASFMSPDMLDEEYLKKAKYLHLTGITPALSDSCYQVILQAIEIAKRNGITVVFDPNLRKKLWSEEKARKVLLDIAGQSDIILPGVAEGEFLFGESDPILLGKRFLEHGAKIVVLKVGAKGAYYFTSDEYKLVPGFKVEKVVDPVGAGDGFAAGFVSGLIDELTIEKAVERGNAVGALVTTISGDVEGLPEKSEIERFIHSPAEDISR